MKLKYRYKEADSEYWSPLVSWEELHKLGLDEETTKIWHEQICPNRKEAESCSHVMMLKVLPIDSDPFPPDTPNNHKILTLIKILIGLMVIVWLVSLFTGGKRELSETEIIKVINESLIEPQEQIQAHIDSVNLYKTETIAGEYYESSQLYTTLQDGLPVLNIKFEYSYTPINIKAQGDTLAIEVFGYCTGCYLYSQSRTASIMIQNTQHVIELFLNDYLESADGVQVLLKGFADGAPVLGKIRYQGEYNNFPTTINSSIISSYKLNGTPIPIVLKKGDSIKNPEIAFLRAVSITEYFENYMSIFQKIKPKYGISAFVEPDITKVGPSYRKVAIHLEVINPKELNKVVAISKFQRLLIWLLPILSAIITSFLLWGARYHYKFWQDGKRKKKDYRQDRKGFWRWLTLSIVFLAISVILIMAIG